MVIKVRRKHMQFEALQDDFALPTENQQIVQVIGIRGNNLIEIGCDDGTTFLASLPNKFRRNAYLKRKGFVLVESIKEGDKVKAEVVKLLTEEHIEHFKQKKVWPTKFMSEEELKNLEEGSKTNC
ncbi:hypothetical protein ABEB36_004508 [Hypothenemus hampei]|uniref:Probable RNA-binding protein EIF1AD n=1 Tax=Hypothenemus hampei TaxID=57062 RepID=A0ABD1F3N0_HYPHA